MATEYVVMGEHTLGYIGDGVAPGYMGVLHGKPTLGGYDWKNGPVPVSFGPLRPATQTDFDFFRVSSNGHLTGIDPHSHDPLDGFGGTRG